MDGHPRKAHKSQHQAIPDLYFDHTPPYALPATIQRESAIRSTLTSSPRDPASLPPGAAPQNIEHDSASNHEATVHQIEQDAGQKSYETSRRDSLQVGGFIPEEDYDGDNDDSDSVHVDMEDGRDAVYMLNSGAGSWSRPLDEDERDPGEEKQLTCTVELALAHLARAQELAAEQQRIVEAASVALESAHRNQGQQLADRPAISATSHNKDLMLRTIMRQIKRALEKGASLTIERVTDNVPSWSCAHVLCTKEKRIIPVDTHYLILHKPPNHSLRYCLTCLENLWNGEGLISPPPSPRIFTNESHSTQKLIFNLDGLSSDEQWIPHSLLTSRHAPPELRLSATPPASSHRSTPSPTTPPSVDEATPLSRTESFRSTTSTGEWRQHPTRFQHLAAFITAGESLNEAERTAVEIWKAASEEQIRWIDFRIKYRCTMEELADLRGKKVESEDSEESVMETPGSEDEVQDRLSCVGSLEGRQGSEVVQPLEHCNDPPLRDEVDSFESVSVSDEHLEARKQCRGRNLSEVLSRLTNV